MSVLYCSDLKTAVVGMSKAANPFLRTAQVHIRTIEISKAIFEINTRYTPTLRLDQRRSKIELIKRSLVQRTTELSVILS